MSANTPPGTRRAAQKEATRATLLEAAERCFAEKGFRATGVKDIATEAGVAHGTFYVHFPSKEAAADALADGMNRALADGLRPILAGAALEPEEAARRAALFFLDHWSRHAPLLRTLAERTGAALDVTTLRDGVNPPALALLASLLGALGVPEVDRPLATHGLLALWLRVGLQHVFGPTPDRESTARVLARMTTGAVFALSRKEEVP